MPDFRAHPSMILRSEEEGICLRLEVLLPAPGAAHLDAHRALLDRIGAALPEGVSMEEGGPGPCDLVDPPEPEPFAERLPKTLVGLVDPGTHWSRLDAARARLERAGVAGADQVLHVPAGWVRLMEGLAEGLSACLEIEPGARIRIQQIKEKFGTLRVYAHLRGGPDFTAAARAVIDWATAAGMRRCALTGRGGMPHDAGWILVLCPQAIVWRVTEPEAFRTALYPPRPGR